MARARFGSEHAQDTSSTPHVQNSLSFEQLGVVHDGRTIGSRPDAILQHLLVYTCIVKQSQLANLHRYEAMNIPKCAYESA